MSVPTKIKFTSFGIPYLLEFENVSFAPKPRPNPHCHPISPSSSSSSSFCYIETPPTPPQPPPFSLRSASSLFKRRHRPSSSSPDLISEPPEHTKPLPPPPAVSETDGIYIQFPPQHPHSQLSRKKRLIHLQKTISDAVLDAGMSRSPANTSLPENHSNDDPANQTRGQKTADALFCGTYGQMTLALEAAGLSVTPCLGDALSAYTRLGALFVARNNGINGVQLRNITLWG